MVVTGAMSPILWPQLGSGKAKKNIWIAAQKWEAAQRASFS